MSKTYRVGCKGLDEYGRGKVVFNNRPFAVSHMLPGEKGNIELVFRAKETTARLVSVDETSVDRVETDCPVYEACGGCQLLHMKYEKQLEWKQNKMEELFPEEAKKGLIAPMISMEQPYHYRHKVYASFASRKKGELTAGIYEENSHRIVEAKNCRIQNETANRIIEEIIYLTKKTGTPAYNEDKRTGVMRHVYIRVGKKTGQVMVVLVTASESFPASKTYVDALTKKFPEIKTILHNINKNKTSMVLGDVEKVLFGPGYIEDELCGIMFEISSKSFYQVNPVQTEKLYQTAVDFAELTGQETVLDAYCGIGTISLVAAKHAKKVIGVELNRTAVQDAKKNAKKNQCNNVEFLDGDAGEYMVKLAGMVKNTEACPDVVFMDPPRSGSDANFINALAKLGPKKVVYISCNPVTQKTDVEMLKKRGYRVKRMQAVDCFCHTYHVENIILLQKDK